MDDKRKGLWCAAACYGIWGLFPLYWYPLDGADFSAGRILAHRIVWTAVFALALVWTLRRGGAVADVFRQPRRLALLAASALLIGGNWLTYLWAIVNNHVLDAGLGYLLSPLLSVFFGGLVFGERLNGRQKTAVALAAAGVLWLGWTGGGLPWVALLLAMSFCGYGLVRKLVPVDALTGLTWETLLLLPFALAYLAGHSADGWFGGLNALQTAVLAASGAVTALPLLLFAAAVRRIPLSLTGMLQYLSPVLQMLLGLTLFGETLGGVCLAGYVWVCAGVAVFLSGLRRAA